MEYNNTMDVKTANTGYSFSVSGILKISAAILAFITMIIIAATVPLQWNAYGYLLFVSIYVWQMCLLLLLRHIFVVEGHRGLDVFEAAGLGLMVVFVAIAMIISAVYASPGGRGINKRALIAVAVFFGAMLISSIVDLFLHIRKML